MVHGTIVKMVLPWYYYSSLSGEESLLALVQAGLMSLMSDVLVLYYSALQTPEVCAKILHTRHLTCILFIR